MIIDKITLHNFGVYKGRQEISLTPISKEKPVVLIGGLNGGGKTTLLDSLQLVLYGKQAHCSNRENFSYHEYLRRCINSSVSNDDGASIEIRFRYYVDGTEHSYIVSRVWQSSGKGIREHLGVIKNGRHDQHLSEHWDEYVEELLPSRIAPLFFFDGEKIEKLADTASSANILNTAIHGLLGLDIVDKLDCDLKVLENRKRTSLQSEQQQFEISKIQNEIAAILARKDDLVQQKGSAQNKLDSLVAELTETEASYVRQGGNALEKKHEFSARRESASARLQTVELELRQMATDSSPLLLVRDLLESTLAHAEREDEALKTMLLRDSLLTRDAKLLSFLGEAKVDVKTQKLVESYLRVDRENDTAATIFPIYLNLGEDGKVALRDIIFKISSVDYPKIHTLLEEQEKIANELDSIDMALKSTPDYDSVVQLIELRAKLKNDISVIEKQITDLNEDIKKADFELKLKENKYSRHLEDSVLDKLKSESSIRILNYSEKVRAVLGLFRGKILEKKLRLLECLILESFQQLLRKKSLFSDLQIDPVNFTVALFDSQREPLSPERLSAGERQLLATSILWGLGRASGKPLPTIVDTPLGRLDASHRNHLIDLYFPFASHQVILLSTDKEIDEEYYNRLKPSVSHAYTLDFDDNERTTRVRKGYFW
ncbi:DNA sulfur modification protein DndD [Geomonas nitrogeniifigens]|uniref:DNA sulfur modification protein DndD n=1 Tax=Geomonas diazotrophica TaxID=2843197 RepID=A0ABX8JIM1_9BACT|nr:DNA sulfur modification protein DndD [Geomonas nitrogeniifigens]QWV98228.1 DNA sulfur modification protein DndD [Geomonas nitrogeniifigens]